LKKKGIPGDSIKNENALDRRYQNHSIDKYLPPTENTYARYPDVLITWEEFGSFVVEIQLSNTFQTEISERCKHYEREGMPILWLLSDLTDKRHIPQCFEDVIARHRGNAFVLDFEATEKSKELKTLILKSYPRSGDKFLKPELVRFDELQFPKSSKCLSR